MTDFAKFTDEIKKNFDNFTKNEGLGLYLIDIDGDKLYSKYLESFPAGTNPIYKERTEYDCSTCRNFIKNIGNIVKIVDNKLISVWDVDSNKVSYPFNEVAKKMGALIRSSKIKSVFFVTEHKYGCKVNSVIEKGASSVTTYHHFYCDVPSKFIVNKKTSSLNSVLAIYKNSKEMLEKSLEEISLSAINTVIELIDQNSIYRGSEHKNLLVQFRDIHKKFTKSTNKDVFLWAHCQQRHISQIKNTAIGTLLCDITNEVDLDVAINKFEKIMAPANYKRPKPIFTAAMIKDAENTINELGRAESLGRRHARLEDISVNDVLFVNRNVAPKLMNSPFDILKGNAQQPTKMSLKSKIEEISIDDFVKNVVPQINSMEVLFEGKHIGNLFNLIAPINKDSKSLFKWPNNFSWSYRGDLADSTKELVKSAGGKVDGVLRYSIRWNDDKVTNSDYDAHCIEPSKHRIYFGSKINYKTSGHLDVDIINPNNQVAVENITWSDINKMDEGIYEFSIHCFSKRNGTGGFSAEIEYGGEIYQFNHPISLKQSETVTVAVIRFSKSKGIEFIKSLKSSVMSTDVWNIKTGQFIPVSMLTYSPNYWVEKPVGNKHYFFVLENCKNDGTPRGFFNEYLSAELNKHSRVFEALSDKMRVEDSDEQVAGLGFSSTKKDNITVRVNGNFSRTLLVKF